jgi:ABC-type uncharacterized transport system ATPase subunit
LVGKKISGVHGIKAAAKDAMEEALTKILTPKQSIDILEEIRLEKQRGNPYIICFVGVNGVGKSTTLAKVLVLHFLVFSSIIRILSHRNFFALPGLSLYQRKPVFGAYCCMRHVQVRRCGAAAGSQPQARDRTV